MRSHRRRAAASALALSGALCLSPVHPVAAAVPCCDILARLGAVPGLKVLEEKASGEPSYRFFLLAFRQPVDHRHPDKGTFEQRLTLMHKDIRRPMVLHTTGFNLVEQPFTSEPAQIVDGNQISVEQRFFAPSRPEPADWSKVDIWQAATDHHRLINALKPVYGKKWISTGAAKGGMTSVYHRRFYPRDVAGTVAYAASNDVNNEDDGAYDRFFETVGSTPTCRNSLKALQREALKRREELVPRYEAYAKEHGYTFKIMKTAERAFEGHVRDAEWTFWQVHLEAECNVPPPTAPTDDIWTFLLKIMDVKWYTDQFFEPYMPYYFQALTQLGWPEPKFEYLRDLRHYPDGYTPRDFVPVSLQTGRFDRGAMADIDRWVREDGSRLMFLYGGNDPWSSEPFRLGRHTRDSYWYKVPGLNSSDRLVQHLASPEQRRATSALRRWTGLKVP